MSFVLLSKKSNQTVTVSLAGHIELVVFTSTSSVDNRLNPALHCKGNATVTSDGFVDKMTAMAVLNVPSARSYHSRRPRARFLTLMDWEKQLSGQGAKTSWESVDLAKRHSHRRNSLVS